MGVKDMTMNDPTLRCHPSGRRISLLNPTLEQIHITDIAHHLSLMPRYLGGTEKAYNNAQHSWFISMNAGKSFELAALLHDAAEYATGDLRGQFKHLPGMEFYLEVQNRIHIKIMQKFGIDWTEELRQYIHTLEKSLFPWEEYLVGRGTLPDWEEFPQMDTIWTSGIAERKFMKRFQLLFKDTE